MSVPWTKVRLGEVLRRSTETVQLQADIEYREVTVRLWGKGVILRGTVSGPGIAGGRRFVARTGQFILSRIDARNGALGIVPATLDGAVVTNDFPLFEVCSARLDPAFLGWRIRTRDFVELCQRASEGTTNRVRLQEERFLALEIPLPQTAEQRRIVARIEGMASKVAEAHYLHQQAGEEADALINTARQTALANCPAKSVDLESICSAIIDNLHSNPRYADSGIPCVRSSDVGYGTLSFDNALRTDEVEYRRRTARGEPHQDDLVLVREGGGTGKCALVPPAHRFSLGQRVMMLRPARERVLPRFLLHQMLSPLIQDDQILPFSKGSASPHLNIGALKRFRFRLPSLAEQERIVAHLDGLQEKIGALRRLQAETGTELAALIPSILSRAFAGRL